MAHANLYIALSITYSHNHTWWQRRLGNLVFMPGLLLLRKKNRVVITKSMLAISHQGLDSPLMQRAWLRCLSLGSPKTDLETICAPSLPHHLSQKICLICPLKTYSWRPHRPWQNSVWLYNEKPLWSFEHEGDKIKVVVFKFPLGYCARQTQ